MKNALISRKGNLNILLLIVLFLGMSSCGIDKAIKDLADEFGDILTNLGNNTNQILDRAVNDLNANASNYGSIMQEAIDQIADQNIKAQLQDALDGAIVTASTEIRCDIQFTGDYLIKKVRGIKAVFNRTPLPPEEPRVCTVVPSVIDMNRSPNDRNSIAITGYFLNEDFSKYKLYLYTNRGSRSNRTSSLSASTDFKLIVNLGSSGITLSDNSAKIVLLWNNNIVSEIPVIQRQPEPCRIRERTLSGLPQMVVYPKHKKSPWVAHKGDKEFAGHGPCTRGNVSIFTRNNGRELWARATVTMWECPDNLGKIREDYSYGDRRMELKLATVDNGWRIKTIKDSRNDSFQNIDRQANRTERFSGSGPVSSYLLQGDTSGDDLGSSRVEITFKSIRVTLEELGDCIRNNNS